MNCKFIRSFNNTLNFVKNTKRVGLKIFLNKKNSDFSIGVS